MKIYFPLIVVLFCLSLTFAQDVKNSIISPSPAATPPPADESEVVKISTTLIQVDATVTDKKNNIVRDLKPEDFEIYENGKKQNITSFSFVSTAPRDQNTPKTSNDSKSADKTKNSIPLPPAKLKLEQVRRTYAMVVDDLGLSFANISYVKDTLKRFINEQMQDGDLVAILRVGSGLGALQSFTSDKRQLLAAVDKIKWNSVSRTGVGSYDALVRDMPASMSESQETADARNESNKAAVASAEADRKSNIAVGALGALKYVIGGMEPLPGRKSIMLFSEGFNLLDYSGLHPIGNKPPDIAPKTTKTLDALRSLIANANRASVVFYTFDPRGITVPGMAEAADDTGPSRNASSSVGKAFGELQTRELEIRDSKDSMKILADETGGLAYVDLNRMDLGVKKALDDQNGYYLIGYQPDEETFDAKKSKFNKLEVKVKAPNVRVRYRSGFFGITDDKLKADLKQNLSPTQKVNAALTSPFGASEVGLDLYSFFYSAEKNKNFIRSFIHINANDLKFIHTAKGKYVAVIDVAAMTFGDNGTPVDQVLKGYTLELDESGYQKTLREGFVYDFLLPVKKPGAYQFRIALRDESTDKVGGASQFIEVPNVNNKKLALSSIILKNYSVADWKKIAAGQKPAEQQKQSIVMDTATREFKRGTVLNYIYEIYNAKTEAAQAPQLQIQVRLFRDGKMILQGNPAALNVKAPSDPQRIPISDAVTLGSDLPPGDYVLQLIISDKLAKDKIASQSIDFEIVN